MFTAIFTSFLHTTLDVLPYFLVAVLLSALLETKLHSDTLLKPFIRGRFAVVWASVLGGILPGCACATVPLAENLRSKGAGLGPTSAFLLVSPLLGPHTIILTYGFLGIDFALWRVVTAMGGAIILGYLFHWFESNGWITLPETPVKSCCSSSRCHSDEHTHLSFVTVFLATLKKLGGYFVIGIFIAAAVGVLIPPSLIPTTIGTGYMAYVVAAVIGIPVYVCEGEEIPITQALLTLNLSSGPAFTFMMGAVGTCIPTMMMARKIIGSRALIIYGAYWFIFAVGSGLLFSLYVR